MRKNNLLKNPIVRAKVGEDVYNPAGSVLEEISEQDMSASGGIWTYDYFHIAAVVMVVRLWGIKERRVQLQKNVWPSVTRYKKTTRSETPCCFNLKIT